MVNADDSAVGNACGTVVARPFAALLRMQGSRIPAGGRAPRLRRFDSTRLRDIVWNQNDVWNNCGRKVVSQFKIGIRRSVITDHHKHRGTRMRTRGQLVNCIMHVDFQLESGAKRRMLSKR